MILTYCAMLFLTVNYWDSDPIITSMKEQTVSEAVRATEQFNYVSAKYGHETLSWGASFKKCEPVPAKDILKEIGYFVEFDGDGKACR